MHARPELVEIIISKKLRRWALISKFGTIDPTCPPSRARRNFWRLLKKHPAVGARLGMTIASVYH
jgi:hypothetical protein